VRYTKEHFWVRDDGDGIVALGITDFAQRELGDIVFVDLPKVGTLLEQGQQLGTVESVKSVSELFAPVTGQVMEVNPVLVDSPELLNVEAESGAWLLKVRLAKSEELNSLLDEAAYKTFVGPKPS
jgi:glycine cleavage system H protein